MIILIKEENMYLFPFYFLFLCNIVTKEIILLSQMSSEMATYYFTLILFRLVGFSVAWMRAYKCI